MAVDPILLNNVQSDCCDYRSKVELHNYLKELVIVLILLEQHMINKSVQRDSKF